MKYGRVKKIALIAIGVSLPVLVSLHPGAQRRADLLAAKFRGYLPGITWTELAVRMLPSPLRTRVGELILPSHPHWIQRLDFPIDRSRPWTVYTIADGPTTRLEMLDCHLSVLGPGVTPHRPHQHPEEELIIPLSGALTIIRVRDTHPPEEATERVVPGQIVFHAADDSHTLRGESPDGPATYLVLKWRANARSKHESVLRSSTFDFDRPEFSSSEASAKFVTHLVFESPTAHLEKLQCHLSILKPDGGYDPHADDYDVALILLSGVVETLGRRVDSPSVVFYSANRTHGIRNTGTSTAKYLVVEFHGSSHIDDH
jgi:quercetin dioxygenase-like cupin family protein